MTKQRWDERCPYCETRVAVYDHFVAHDYAVDFTFDCPLCEEEITVDVEAVPEFGLSKT